MKPLYLAAAFAAVLISCSKSSQENNDTSAIDSTDVNADPNEGTAQRETNQKPLDLSGNDLERFKAKVFLYLHDLEVLPGKQMMIREDFDYSDNVITYDIAVYNKVHTRYDEEGNRILEEGEATTEVYMSADENRTVPANDPINEMDEVSYRLENVKVYDISKPESRTKRVKVVFAGTRTWGAPHMNVYGMTEVYPDEQVVKSFELELGDPVFTKDQLYLKAKIERLDEDDLKGMSKDQLGYLRNEIFARHGHIFKTAKMKDYFSKQEWYFEVYDDAQQYLNELEKQNIDFIKKREG